MSAAYALLHDRPPGPIHQDGVMAEHASLHLSAWFDRDEVVARADARFRITRVGRPAYITVWNGPVFVAVIAMPRHGPAGTTVRPGDTINVDLKWRMATQPETVSWE